MASIIKRPNGHHWISFYDTDPTRRRVRRTLRLGTTPIDDVLVIASRVKGLIRIKKEGAAADQELAAELAMWLAGIKDQLHKKLVGVKLCSPRSGQQVAILGRFIESYVNSRRDVEASTKDVWRQGASALVEFFGADRPLRSVNAGDADRYKAELAGSPRKPRKTRKSASPYDAAEPAPDKAPGELSIANILAPLSAGTIRKRLQFARMIFGAAVRSKLIAENPFEDVSLKKPPKNRDREVFVTAEQIEQILAKCPDHHWHAIVILARYGGLRCPSEVLELRWRHVDFEAGRLIVPSPKTKRYPGKDKRVCPLFPQIRDALLTSHKKAKGAAGDRDLDDEFVIDERFRKARKGTSGWRNVNLHTGFKKIIVKAGLRPWPDLFRNLRSTCGTELIDSGFPEHVESEWLGHSIEVARKHYLQTTDAHFARAIGQLLPADPNLHPNPCRVDLGQNEPVERSKTPHYAQISVDRRMRRDSNSAVNPGGLRVLGGRSESTPESVADPRLAAIAESWDRLTDSEKDHLARAAELLVGQDRRASCGEGLESVLRRRPAAGGRKSSRRKKGIA